MLQLDNRTTTLPDVDKVPIVAGSEVSGEMTPTYPVIQYGHVPGGGDAIGSGFVYDGKAIPALQGKYLFTDLSTGRVWYANYDEMLAADDGKPATLAAMHELKIVWDDPADSPDAGKQTYDTMFPIAKAAYRARGGNDPDLPGRASGVGRRSRRRPLCRGCRRRALHLQQVGRHDPRRHRCDGEVVASIRSEPSPASAPAGARCRAR